MTTRRPGHFHAVKFYDSSEALGRIAAEFLGEGLASQQRALVIVTPGHRKRILAELHARHFDVKALEADGDMVCSMQTRCSGRSWWAEGPTRTCSRPTRRAWSIDWAAGRSAATARESTSSGRPASTMRPSGSRTMWNRLTATRDIKTLCAYSVSNFYKDTSLRAIFDEHSHVVSDKGALVDAHPTVRWASPPASQRPS